MSFFLNCVTKWVTWLTALLQFLDNNSQVGWNFKLKIFIRRPAHFLLCLQFSILLFRVNKTNVILVFPPSSIRLDTALLTFTFHIKTEPICSFYADHSTKYLLNCSVKIFENSLWIFEKQTKNLFYIITLFKFSLVKSVLGKWNLLSLTSSNHYKSYPFASKCASSRILNF